MLILREVIDLSGKVTQRNLISLEGPGNPLRTEIVSLLRNSELEVLTFEYPDHKKVYRHVDSTEGAAEGPPISEVDDKTSSAISNWFQRALVRVCSEICRRGMGS